MFAQMQRPRLVPSQQSPSAPRQATRRPSRLGGNDKQRGTRLGRPQQPVVSFLERRSESASADPASPNAKPTAAAGKSSSCSVKSFSLSVNPWAEHRLPIDFKLELGKGCTRKDVIIGQSKRGQVEMGSDVEHFTSWTSDVPLGERGWWDGDKWTIGGWNSWSWFGETAKFEDKPGFAWIKDYPAYWDGIDHKGHFEFRTWVKDRKTLSTLRELRWGILIDVPNERSKGRHFFYL
jgi:hypothetical protein